jgi:hypothetical protein
MKPSSGKRMQKRVAGLPEFNFCELFGRILRKIVIGRSTLAQPNVALMSRHLLLLVMVLDSLILRLSGDWEFIETGKMYWIGYTNDMFSIAARGDSAIGPLVKVVETSSNQKARLGAIYTLHLIGINRKIIGRFVEAFVDANARKALLSLLKYDDLQPTIMELLIRDPWKTEVP